MAQVNAEVVRRTVAPCPYACITDLGRSRTYHPKTKHGYDENGVHLWNMRWEDPGQDTIFDGAVKNCDGTFIGGETDPTLQATIGSVKCSSKLTPVTRGKQQQDTITLLSGGYNYQPTDDGGNHQPLATRRRFL